MPRREFGSLSSFAPLAVALLAAACSPKGSPPKGQPQQQQQQAAVDPIAQAEAGVKSSPSVDSYTALGLAYANAQRHPEALAAFERALALDPRSAMAHNNVCAMKIELREWATAITHCRKALAVSPDFEHAKNNLARAEAGEKEERTRVIDLQKAIAAGKDVDRNRIELGLAHYRRGNFDEAIAAWKQVPESSDQYATAQNDIGSVNIVRKRFGEAEKALAKAIQREPDNTLFKNNLEWLKAEMKRK